MKTLIAAAVAASILTLTGPADAAAACSTPWGSQPKIVSNDRHGTVTAIRAGRHTCFDRLVLDLDRNGTGYRISYVKAVRDQGRGAVVPLRGGAFLEVVSQTQATRRIPMPSVAGFSSLRDVRWGGSFEGWTTVGVGTRARLPFRVLTVDRRLVIDVAHRWS